MAEATKPRIAALLGSLVFLIVAPGAVAGLGPWWISGWRVRAPLFGLEPLRLIGWAVLACGLSALLESFARFALVGIGTPAPVAPTRALVVSGLYRYVRNPMYLAVTAINVGQGLILGDARLLAYAAVIWLGFHLFVVLYEEPTLRRTYGVQYQAFCAAVRRWIPRPTPWRGAAE
jgi:protein-S-isoprenylcysteine O-methyltransferase Ste14